MSTRDPDEIVEAHRAGRAAALSIAAVLSIALGCGPEGSAGDECVHVDGRGGAGADGTEERPLRTIADALAVVADGGAICLSPGEHPSPGTIARSVTIRGAVRSGTAPASTLLPPSAGCATASGLDASDLGGPDVLDASAALITEGDADVVLEDVAIGGCDHAIVARARSTSIARVLVGRARVGVAVDAAAAATVTDSQIAVAMPLVGDVDLACAVCGGRGARVVIRGSDLDAGAHGWDVAGAVASLLVEGSALHGAFAGLAIGGTDSRAEQVTIGEGTVVRDLAALSFGVELPSANLISHSASVDVHDARFEAARPSALGLQIVDADDTRIERTRLTGFDYFGLGVVGGSFVIGEGVELETAREGVALIAGGIPGREPGPTTLVVEGALASAATGAVRHVLVQGMGSLELAGSATLRGGEIGVQGIDGARIEGAGAWTVEDVAGAALSLLGAARASVQTLDAVVRDGARGADVSEDATLELLGGTIAGGLFGVHARERASLRLEGVLVSGGSEAGVVIEGAGPDATVTRVEVIGAGLGLAVRDGRSVSARELTVRESAGSGVEVVAASLDLEGGALEDNVGAAIAFEDAEGSVRSMVVRGTDARGDDRADEVRLVSTDGAEHVVEVSGNMFVVTGGRSCTGGCSVILASGMGAHGIIRPNCLTATGGAADTFTLATQSGGMLEEPTPAAWADLLLGRSAGVSWLAGSAIALPAPVALAADRIPTIEIPPGL